MKALKSMLYRYPINFQWSFQRRRFFTVFAHRSPLRLAGGAAKPGWHVSRAHKWGPEVRDNQYYWDHPTYTGFVLWWRGIRPYLEKLLGDGCRTLRFVLMDCAVLPVRNVVVKHNPDVRLQLVAFISFYFTAQSINMALNRYYQKLMDLKHLQSLKLGMALQSEGFFRSESEDLDQRVQDYSADHSRLNALWDAACAEATDLQDPDLGFLHLCNRLSQIDLESHPSTIPSPMTWRLNMIPYGGETSETFPVPSHEQPHRAFALNFTYNNLFHNWGDYVDRKDNKPPPMRPTRQMFADVYLPPTK